MRTMTIKQAERKYGTTRQTIWNYRQLGLLTAHKAGPKQVRLYVEELDRVFGGELVDDEDY